MDNQTQQPISEPLGVLFDDQKAKKPKTGIIVTSLLGAFCVLMVFILIFTLTVTLCEVNMHSMMPTLEHQSHVLLVNNPRNLRRRDVVTVSTNQELLQHYYNNDVELFIKRVIAIGGDTVIWRVSENFTYYYTRRYNNVPRRINAPEIYLYISRQGADPVRLNEIVGEDILETMAFSALFTPSDFGFEDGVLQSSYEVPVGSVYVLGDNRNNSIDSRTYGSFKNNYITGRMFFRLNKGGFLERFLLWLYGAPR